MIDMPDKPFHDPVADAALFAALRGELRPHIELVEMACDINDPSFGAAMADRLDRLIVAAVQGTQRVEIE